MINREHPKLTQKGTLIKMVKSHLPAGTNFKSIWQRLTSFSSCEPPPNDQNAAGKSTAAPPLTCKLQLGVLKQNKILSRIKSCKPKLDNTGLAQGASSPQMKTPKLQHAKALIAQQPWPSWLDTKGWRPPFILEVNIPPELFKTEHMVLY